MKVSVDADLCTGHGRCYAVAAQVYTPDGEGYNVARGGVIDVPAGHEEEALRGLRSCPEGALARLDQPAATSR